MKEKFPCTSCGLCCRRIQNLKEFSAKLAIEKHISEIEFPYTHSEGVCEKLVDNKCSIYDDRPLICSIEKMDPILNFPIFYKMNADICNLLIKEEGLDESFLINL